MTLEKIEKFYIFQIPNKFSSVEAPSQRGKNFRVWKYYEI